tara:strand:- start:104 stop:409 length:306 start_codon:yes stop_codon:yes gene_type:complete
MNQYLNIPPPHPLVKKNLLKGVEFSNELLYAIETISKKYEEHISHSIELGHFYKLDKSILYVCRNLIEYNKEYKKFLREYYEYEKKYSYPNIHGSLKQPKL